MAETDPPQSKRGPETDAPPSTPGPEPAAPAPRRRYMPIVIAVLTLAIMGGSAALYWQLYMRGIVYTDDARVDAHLVDVAPEVGGTLIRLAVHEGDHVAAGALLFELDKSTLTATLARAQAEVGAAEAQVALAEADRDKALHGPRAAEIRIALAAKERAAAQAELANDEWERTKALFEKSVVPDAKRQRAETNWESAQRANQEAENRLQLLRSGTRLEDLAAAKARVAAAKASLAAAQAAVKQAELNIARCQVEAPFAGIVAREWRQPGAMISPGTPVLTLLDPTTLRVAANIDEKDLGLIGIGDPVAISVDAFPDTPLSGHVDTILRATNSEFGLVPSEGISGTFIKVTQRVPLRIKLDALPSDLELSPGLSVEVRIRTTGAPQPTALSSRD